MSVTSPGRAVDGLAERLSAADPVFIGGLDRTGKTTMRAFLTSHPNIAIPSVGSNMWTYFYRQYGDLKNPDGLERCLQAMLRYKHVAFLRPDADRIRREFAQGSPTYARLFALFLKHFAEREGKPRWGAQTGLIERYADPLFEGHPGAKVVHMVRDPRDRYEASLDLWPDGRGRAGGATARWTYSMRLAARNLRRHPDGYTLVRFEDLVLHTEDTLRRVCDFLGETFVPEMLTMSGAPVHRERLEAMTNERGRAASGPLSAAAIGGFRGRVPQPELVFMQLHAGRAMRAHGYAIDPARLSARGWVRFAARDWPSQAARMAAWRSVEVLQQRFPSVVHRRPHRRMIVEGAADER